MTIAELITALRGLPDHLDVVIQTKDDYMDIAEVGAGPDYEGQTVLLLRADDM